MTLIVVEDRPVEFLPIAANVFPFRVEEKIVGKPLVGFGLTQVFGSTDIEGLNDRKRLQCSDIRWRFQPV